MNVGNDLRVRDKQEKGLQGIYRNKGQRKISYEWQLWVENGLWTVKQKWLKTIAILHVYIYISWHCLMLDISAEYNI